jgi:hypothetical protein
MEAFEDHIILFLTSQRALCPCRYLCPFLCHSKVNDHWSRARNNRTTFSNNVNEHSSRSHLVLSLYCKGQSATGATTVQLVLSFFLHLLCCPRPLSLPLTLPLPLSATLTASTIMFQHDAHCSHHHNYTPCAGARIHVTHSLTQHTTHNLSLSLILSVILSPRLSASCI